MNTGPAIQSGSAVECVTAVVLAYGEEPWLEECLRSVLASERVAVHVVLVDNGCTSKSVARAAALPGVRVVRPGTNLGFAGGVNYGAQFAGGDYLALVNSDAVLDRQALARLVAVAAEPGVGIASGSIRLADAPDTINSAGNPLNFLGLVWAGGYGESASAHAARVQVPCASGAGLALRRSLWESLGGFAPEYFAYHEDAELSVRCWQRGLTVEYVPDAVVVHHYRFARNAMKLYLLERNRLIFVTTLYQARTLAVLLPALIASELAVLVLALAQGWARQKILGWWWLCRHARWIRRRRARLQSERTLSDGQLASLVTGGFHPGNIAIPTGGRLADHAFTAYWTLARRLLR